MRKPGRARNDVPSPPEQAPKTHDELQALLEKTWQDACDAEFERADEEYRFLRAATVAFDAVVQAGRSSWECLKPPRLQDCSAVEAMEFAKRVQVVLEAEPRLKALDAFEAATGLAVDDERLAKIDGQAVKALRENPSHAGVVLSNLRLSLEQLDTGRKRLAEVVKNMDKALSGAPHALLASNVRRLGLSTRALNCLSNERVKTISDLCAMRESDLLELKNFGQTTLNEIREKLAEYGLALASSEA